MILADTSIWVEYLHRGHARFAQALDHEMIAVHPWVVGEVSLGNIPDRTTVIALMMRLPRVSGATDVEVDQLIDEAELAGRGVGFVDVHLIAAALVDDCALWTLDKRMSRVAGELGMTLYS